ncbi:uncharacterized protein LOC132605598 [Lycium barbarum]|uniref:uncharacterized protein LOC132605598 n=1 Tax=Lycium barbarum TaxID=112863 RepID=UPI00293E4F9A|nr:uncharacterized protein LOC132605598 [Lycium barbarum]XP_060174721.1 uncharacterized protein LOC132605598 [Lycium barbarum]
MDLTRNNFGWSLSLLYTWSTSYLRSIVLDGNQFKGTVLCPLLYDSDGLIQETCSAYCVSLTYLVDAKWKCIIPQFWVVNVQFIWSSGTLYLMIIVLNAQCLILRTASNSQELTLTSNVVEVIASSLTEMKLCEMRGYQFLEC